MAFKKHVVPLQREGDALSFNVRPLDTILYKKSNFRELANQAIDDAILRTGTTSRPTRALTSNDTLLRYTAVLGLRVTQLNTDEANYLYKLGQPMGFLLLDGSDIVYLGLFDLESAKEVVLRIKLLLQALQNAKYQFETATRKNMTPEQVENALRIWSLLRIEVLVSKEVDKEKVSNKVAELTKDFVKVPWKVIQETDMRHVIDRAYDEICEL